MERRAKTRLQSVIPVSTMLGSWLNGVKSLLVVVSIFFFLTGVAVVGLGVWTASNPGEALRVMTSRYRSFPEAAFPLLLVMGTILIAVGVTLLL
uniref:Uncharacterized protein n=1 Tax=Eptatretus burgeri TaxID=7764 RepID=A0A8C4QF53_EPTBU